MLENIGHIRPMRCAISGPGRALRIIRVLIKIVVENLGLSGLCLQPSPGPRVPAERRVAGQIARGFRNRIGVHGISFDQIVGELAVTRLDAGQVILRSFRRRKACAFVGIVAHENGRVVVFARRVKLVLIARNPSCPTR